MEINNNLQAVENQIPSCPGSIQCSDCIIVLTRCDDNKLVDIWWWPAVHSRPITVKSLTRHNMMLPPASPLLAINSEHNKIHTHTTKLHHQYHH